MASLATTVNRGCFSSKRMQEGVPRREENRQTGRRQLGVHCGLARRVDSESKDEP